MQVEPQVTTSILIKLEIKTFWKVQDNNNNTLIFQRIM